MDAHPEGGPGLGGVMEREEREGARERKGECLVDLCAEWLAAMSVMDEGLWNPNK